MRYNGIFQIMEPRNLLKPDFETSVTFEPLGFFFMWFSLLCSGEWALSYYICIFIYIGVSLKKEIHVYKLSLCTYNQIVGLLQHFVSPCSRVCMVWTERNKGFVACSDSVGYGNSLSNRLTFLLSSTELITLTVLELAIGFLEEFCYLLF